MTLAISNRVCAVSASAELGDAKRTRVADCGHGERRRLHAGGVVTLATSNRVGAVSASAEPQARALP
jgi:hypothetical protein